MSQGTVKQPKHKGVARVPVVMQMEALECGAACLCMVSAFYGKWVPLEQVRSDCGVSRDGSNAKNILKAARSYGFQAEGFRVEPEVLKEKGSFPCIVHWDFNHFVVVDGFRGNKVYLNDPAKGAYSVSREVFDESFTGICLMMTPGEDFEPGGKPKSVLSFARRRLAGLEPAVLLVVMTTVISSLTGIFRAGFTRVFLDQVLTGLDRGLLLPLILFLAFINVLQLAGAWIQAVYSIRINGKMAVSGNLEYMWKVLRLPMEFFSQRMAGDIQQRQGTNAGIANRVVYAFAPLVLNAFMAVFYLLVMVRYSLLLTVVGLITVFINVGLSRVISLQRINVTRVLMRDAGKLNGTAVSGIEMMETIKASGAENGFFEKWAGYQAGVNTQNVRFQKIDAFLGIIPDIASEAADIIVLSLGMALVLRGKFTPGMILVFQGFMSSFLAPTENMIAVGQDLQELRTEMEEVEDILEYPEDPMLSEGETEISEGETEKERENPAKLTSGKLSGALSMRHVTFGYSRVAPPLIEDFNLELEPGKSVAFVGFSGCGKSTLSKLISGLYQPWEGEILFDGKPIQEIDRHVFTGSVSVVDQDIILFEDTIFENIRMWDRAIEDFEVIMAARDARIHDDIMRRTGGYQYRLTEGGKDLSGGQRQRLEIARVLAADPTLIILDEATSALDAKTEAEVVSSIRDRGITCIVIAHRLSTIRDCDEILVVESGKVTERGTHEELMRSGELYPRLVISE